MKTSDRLPVRHMQSILHESFDGGAVGNCVQACVASLLSLPLDAVPHFFHDATEEKYAHCWFRFDEWFAQFGLYADHRQSSPNNGYCFPHLASGLSPRGVNHQVIRDGLDIIHDPHPDGGGVVVDEVTLLIVTDPMKLQKLDELRGAAR